MDSFDSLQPGGQPLDFDEFADQLLEQGVDCSPSHLHGALCGALAGGVKRQPDNCLDAIIRGLDLDLQGRLAALCLELAGVTIAALEDEAFDFHLFLPGDDTELDVRVQALADWCSGFLSGFAVVVAQPASGGLGEEAAEILGDVSAIAEAARDEEVEEEESEQDFFELTEYLRFATLNLYLGGQE